MIVWLLHQELRNGADVGLVLGDVETMHCIKMAGIWPGPGNKYFPHIKSSLGKCDHFADWAITGTEMLSVLVNQWSGTWHNEQNIVLLSELFKTLHLSLTALSKSLCLKMLFKVQIMKSILYSLSLWSRKNIFLFIIREFS